MNDMVIHEQRPSSMALMTAADILAQVTVVRQVMEAVMKLDVHYGIVPGTKKPSLWKPGAEVLCAVFRIADKYELEDLSTDDCVRYRVRCRGVHQTTGIVMGEGLGECSSHEEKYKWVRCYSKSEFQATIENRRRIQYGRSKDGREYENMQVRTEAADLANTILKMATKRAKIAMTLNVTAASDVFSQDLEDLSERLRQTVDDEAKGDGVKGPQSNGEAEARKRMEQHGVATGPGDGKEEESKESPPASDGMLRLLRKKIEDAKLDEAAFLKEHGLEALPGINVAKGNELLKAVAAAGANA